MTGDVVGTLRYMSPEQAAGEHSVVDYRTDIYSLGVTIYELLTLRPAFDGEGQQQIFSQIFDPPPTPRSIVPGIPVDEAT